MIRSYYSRRWIFVSLVVVVLIVFIVATRVWFGAEYKHQLQIANRLESQGCKVFWAYCTPEWSQYLTSKDVGLRIVTVEYRRQDLDLMKGIDDIAQLPDCTLLGWGNAGLSDEAIHRVELLPQIRLLDVYFPDEGRNDNEAAKARCEKIAQLIGRDVYWYWVKQSAE